MIIYHGGGSYLLNEACSEMLREKREKYDVIESYINKNLIIRSFGLPHINKFFVDSGAFSVWTKGDVVDLDEYIKFLHEYKDKIDVYAALDDIEDPAISLENYKIMLKEGLEPVPVYHLGEDLKWIHIYADMTDYIGIGGDLGLIATKHSVKQLNLIFSLFPDPKWIKFHGFGVTSPVVLEHYPWYSVDSTSAFKSAFFGSIMSPWGNIRLSDRVKHVRPKGISFDNLLKWIKEKNGDPESLMNGEREGVIRRLSFNCSFIEEMAEKSVPIFKGKVARLF